MSSDAIETYGYIFKGNIYHCKTLYRYHNIFALKSRTSASFLQSQTLKRPMLDPPLNSANTDIYAYSDTMFGGPTLGYVMAENWIYGCYGLNEDVSDSHLGHTENRHTKNSAQNPFCEPY